jgi:predicted RecA/RadA family phage recombinase
LGQKLYYDSSEDEVVTDSGANKVIGYAAAGAASGAAEGLVLLGT